MIRPATGRDAMKAQERERRVRLMEQLQDEIQRREDRTRHWPDMKHLMVDRWETND